MPLLEKLAQLWAVALFALPGVALAQRFAVLRAMPPYRRSAYGYLLGVAWVGGTLFAASALLAVPLRRGPVLVVAVLPLAAGLVRTWRARASPAGRATRPVVRRSRPVLAEGVAIVVAAIVFLAVLAKVLSTPLSDWDGRMTWAMAARWMRAEATVTPRALAEPGWFATHPGYPPLLPVAQVAALELVGAGEDVPAYRAVYAFFFPVWLVLIHQGARRWARRTPAALATLAAAVLPLPAFSPIGGAVGAYSDLPLACFYGGALLLLLRAGKKPATWAAAGGLLAAAVLTKNEGLPLALVAVVATGLLPWRARGLRGAFEWVRRRRLPFLAVTTPIAAGVALLLVWRAGVASPLSLVRDVVAVHGERGGATWAGAVENAPRVLFAIGARMASPREWGLFWPAALLVLVAGRRALRRAVALPIGMAAAGPLPIAFAAYAISLHPYALAVQTWNRFVLQASVPLFVLLALALDELARRPGATAPPPPH